MAVTVNNQSLNKKLINASGDTVTYSFGAGNTLSKPASFKAAFMISSNQPYTFSNGTRTIVHGPVSLAAKGSQPISKPLKVVKQGSGTSMRLDLMLFIQELSASGQPGRSFEATPRLFVTPAATRSLSRAPAPRKAAKAAKRPATRSAAARPTAVGDRLRQHRKKHGLTQAEVAKQSGVSPSTVSRLENGGSPAPGTRAKIEVMMN